MEFFEALCQLFQVLRRKFGTLRFNFLNGWIRKKNMIPSGQVKRNTEGMARYGLTRLLESFLCLAFSRTVQSAGKKEEVDSASPEIENNRKLLQT